MREQQQDPDYNSRKARVDNFLLAREWRFAKSMPRIPHWYIVKDKLPKNTKNGVNLQEEFVNAVVFMREFGTQERWGAWVFTYYYLGEYKYWTMGAPLEQTIIINRARVE